MFVLRLSSLYSDIATPLGLGDGVGSPSFAPSFRLSATFKDMNGIILFVVSMTYLTKASAGQKRDVIDHLKQYATWEDASSISFEKASTVLQGHDQATDEISLS